MWVSRFVKVEIPVGCRKGRAGREKKSVIFEADPKAKCESPWSSCWSSWPCWNSSQQQEHIRYVLTRSDP
eukprot:jgi/Picre1/34304/NNA_001777.t1